VSGRRDAGDLVEAIRASRQLLAAIEARLDTGYGGSHGGDGDGDAGDRALSSTATAPAEGNRA
jgi:hypothetical protein